MKKLTLFLIAFAMVFSFAGVAVVEAQVTTPIGEQTVPTLGTTELFSRIDTIVNWVFTVLVVMAVFMVLMAAFQFVTAGDNAESLSAARQKLIWAAVGIVIALLAKSLPLLIVNTIGA